jgi:hypothetical protein
MVGELRYSRRDSALETSTSMYSMVLETMDA